MNDIFKNIELLKRRSKKYEDILRKSSPITKSYREKLETDYESFKDSIQKLSEHCM